MVKGLLCCCQHLTVSVPIHANLCLKSLHACRNGSKSPDGKKDVDERIGGKKAKSRRPAQIPPACLLHHDVNLTSTSRSIIPTLSSSTPPSPHPLPLSNPPLDPALQTLPIPTIFNARNPNPNPRPRRALANRRLPPRVRRPRLPRRWPRGIKSTRVQMARRGSRGRVGK